MLFEKTMVFSKFLCSLYEKKIEMILIKGSDIKKPARTGFLNDNQLAVDIIKPDIKTLIIKKNNDEKKLRKKTSFVQQLYFP